MLNENVQLLFAETKKGDVVTINEVDKEANEIYHCPLCRSEVIPRQGEINAWCFAHIDKSNCSSESMYHFWVKNKLLQKGDEFKIRTDIERKYICDEILVEESYKIGNKEYRPDLTVKTTSGEMIYFEMNYSNEKKLEDYLDMWIELGNIIVEVDVKTLIDFESGKLPVFKAKYYNGKCFNVKKGEDKTYHDTIGQYKEKLIKDNKFNKHKEDIEKLDWFWKDVQKYKMKEVDTEHISNLIQSIEDEESKEVVVSVLKKSSCQNVIKNYVEYNKNNIENIFNSFDINDLKYDIKIPHKIYNRLFNFKVNFNYKNSNDLDIDVNSSMEYIENIINDIEKEIKDENKNIEMIKSLKKYVEVNYNYNNICKYIKLQNEPYLNEYKEKMKPTMYGIKNAYRLYINNTLSSWGSYIKMKDYKDIMDRQKSIDKKISYNTYKFFSKEDILQIDNVAKNLSKTYKEIDNNIELIFTVWERKYIKIHIKYDNENTEFIENIEVYKDRYFYAMDLYRYIYLLIGVRINKIKKYIQKINFINEIIKSVNKKLKEDNLTNEWKVKFSHDYHFKNGEIDILNNNHYMFDSCSSIINNYLKTNKISNEKLTKKINNIIKHEILEHIYNKKRSIKYINDFYDIRNYKKKILKGLRESNFDILKIQPMCNKPYIGLKYANNINQIIFLSKCGYDNCKIDTSVYDIVTILNKNTDLNSTYNEDVKDYMIIKFDNKKYEFINKNQWIKSIIIDEISREKSFYNKDINLFYYKSRPKDKKYRNLNKFNFVKTIDLLKFINKKYITNSSYKEFKDIILKIPYCILYTELNEMKTLVLSQETVFNFLNSFLKTVRTIKNNEVNILLDIKYTNLYDRGYQPWLIEDFISELKLLELEFNSISNTKEEKRFNEQW